jgi:hypothetical protein
MIPVAGAKGITIYAPPEGIVGFHTSPYPVHVQGGAMDIFGSKKFDVAALSPVSGKVTLIDKSKVGVPRHFKSDPHDYIIVLKNNDVCVRFLHIEPIVEVGDSIDVGDEIGQYIRTPLLPFWSYPHIHLEVKDCKDVQTALNAFPLKILVESGFHGEPENDYKNIEAKVKLFTENYIIVTPRIDMFGKIGEFFGVAVKVGHEQGLLDAQTPWNCYGGVILSENSKVKVGDVVKLGAVELGMVTSVYGGMATYALGGELGDGIDRYSKGLLYKDVGRFNVPYRRIRVNGTIFLGMSTGLSLSENRTLRLIPTRPLEQRYEVGEDVTIELDYSGGK